MLGYFYCIYYLPESQLLQNHYAYHVILWIGGSLLQLPDLNRNLCVLSFFSTLDYPEREIRMPVSVNHTIAPPHRAHHSSGSLKGSSFSLTYLF